MLALQRPSSKASGHFRANSGQLMMILGEFSYIRSKNKMIKDHFQKIKEFYDGKNGFIIDVALFAIITFTFHELWWTFSAFIKSFGFVLNTAEWLSDQVFAAAYWFNIHILGLQITDEGANLMRFSNGGYVQVVESCSGLKQFYQIFVLFLLFPGPWKHKLWFIPMSIIIMHIVNISRIIILSIMVVWKPEYWNFTHDWILRPGFYIVIFMLWVWWVEKFRQKNKKTSQRNQI